MFCEITWHLAITCALKEYQNSVGMNVIIKEIHRKTKKPIRFFSTVDSCGIIACLKFFLFFLFCHFLIVIHQWR